MTKQQAIMIGNLLHQLEQMRRERDELREAVRQYLRDYGSDVPETLEPLIALVAESEADDE